MHPRLVEFAKLLLFMLVCMFYSYALAMEKECNDNSYSKVFSGICNSKEEPMANNPYALISKEYYDQGIYAGYIYYRQFAGDPTRGFIFSLKIEDTFTHKGYAQQLIEYACNDLKIRGCTTVNFNLGESNHPAGNLLQKLGFYRDKKLIQNVINFNKDLVSPNANINYQGIKKYILLTTITLCAIYLTWFLLAKHITTGQFLQDIVAILDQQDYAKAYNFAAHYLATNQALSPQQIQLIEDAIYQIEPNPSNIDLVDLLYLIKHCAIA